MKNPIPKITDPMGASWQQPNSDNFEWVDENEVIMSKADFELLPRYDRGHPSGVYEGKMWVSSASLSEDYLKWFENDPRYPDSCVRNRAVIRIRENMKPKPSKEPTVTNEMLKLMRPDEIRAVWHDFNEEQLRIAVQVLLRHTGGK